MNIDDLRKKLDECTEWRKSELVQASDLAKNAHDEYAERYLCRAWILVIYAHCDNFLKDIIIIYIDYIKLNPNIRYQYDIIWSIKNLNENIDAKDNKYKSFKSFKTLPSEECFTHIEYILKKRSFNYKTLRFMCDWILQIDFNHQNYQAFCHFFIDKRNSIAHGEQTYVDTNADCQPWHDKAFEFMDDLRDKILETLL